jgi:TolB protein
MLVPILILLGIGYLSYRSYELLKDPIEQVMADSRERRNLLQLRADCRSLSAGGKWGEAKSCWEEFLIVVPGDERALEALEEIAEEQEIEALYQQAVSLQESGDLEAALERFNELASRRVRYKDMSQRVSVILTQQNIDSLFDQAETAYEEERLHEAVLLFEEIRTRDVSYQRDLVADRLYELYVAQGREIIYHDAPGTLGVAQAIDFFRDALTLKPRGTAAAQEIEWATQYSRGEAHYEAGNWSQAIAQLRGVYEDRPNYLGGRVATQLYEASISLGDQYLGAGDCALAFEFFQQAEALPVDDTTLATSRKEAARPCITPSPTPTFTPTPSSTPTASPTATVTPTRPPPSPTAPPRRLNLSNQSGRIVFRSNQEGRGELWIMDASGGNRRNLYSYAPHAQNYENQYTALREQEIHSADGYRVYTTEAQEEPQIWIMPPVSEQYGQPPPWQLTFLAKLSYDPVWSPDNFHIAFVSQEHGSDDVWVITRDGTGLRALVQNTWQWDKHPSWSPDGARIVFWSNRTGVKQVFVMNADGSNVTNLSKSEWDEYDPIWIK